MKGLSINFTLFFLCLFAGSCQRSSLPELHIFIWSDYIKPEVIEQFETKYHCRIVMDTFDSNEAMYAKIKLGVSDYDVVFPSNYYLDLMIQQGMLQKIDPMKIPNSRNIDARYLQGIDKDTLNYAIPYLISHTGIAYRRDKVKDFISSWNIFNRKALKGRMTMLNDMREAFGASLITLGFSVNTVHLAEINQAAELLIQWKRNLAKFESEQYKNGIASAEYLVVQAYAGDILQVMQENNEVAFDYPKEGSMMSIDYAVIPKEAQQAELAHAFVNFLLEPEVAAENMLFTLYLSPSIPAYEKLPPELKNNTIFFPPEDVLKNAELIKNVGDAIRFYNKAWDRVKAAD